MALYDTDDEQEKVVLVGVELNLLTTAGSR